MTDNNNNDNNRINILIYGDVIAYEAAFIAQYPVEWEDDLWTLHADMGRAKDYIHERITELEERLGAKTTTIAFSDRANFRRKLNPMYKSNRRSSFKPIILKACREWMMDTYNSECWPNLEADDVLSILATERPNRLDTRIIVSIDKDFHGVPGRWYNFRKDEYHYPTKEEADKFHLLQAVMGDHTDGYGGVPGYGLKTAQKYLEKNGYTWEAVSQLYAKKELPESEALMNAWMARLLRKDDYNIKQKEITYLWMPTSYQPADKRKYSQAVHSVTGKLGEEDTTLFPHAPFTPLPNALSKEPKTTALTTG